MASMTRTIFRNHNKLRRYPQEGHAKGRKKRPTKKGE